MKEAWKDIKDFESYYKVSNYGNVKSLYKNIILSNGLSDTGYYIVMLCKKGKGHTKSVHRLVAEHFIPNPENKPTVNHKDATKTNNRASNLEWMTYKENIRHSINAGLTRYPRRIGEPKAKLTERSVIDIRCKLKNGDSVNGLAKIHGVARNTIRRIRDNKSWKHVS